MNFMSATQMGKEVALSYQKIFKILTEEGLYEKEEKRPTQRAFDENMAEMRTTESRFTGKTVEYIAWDFDVVVKYLPRPTLEEMVLFNCRRSMNAHELICGAFSDFGDMLDISNEPHKKVSQRAVDAVVQSYFGDPAHLGRTLLYHRFMRAEEVEVAKNVTLPLAQELFKAAKKVDAVRAKNCLQTIEVVFDWLSDKAC